MVINKKSGVSCHLCSFGKRNCHIWTLDYTQPTLILEFQVPAHITLHKHNSPILLRPESWAASKCYSAVYLISGLIKKADVGFVWKVLLLHQLCDGDPNSSRLVGQHKCCRIRHPRADRRQWKVGGWTQPTKFLAKLNLRIGFNMHNAPCKSMDHRLDWTRSRVHRPAKGSLMPACLSSLIHAKEDCSIERKWCRFESGNISIHIFVVDKPMTMFTNIAL